IVAFTACLLDFRVAYVPVEGNAAFLAGVPLDIYECVVGGSQHGGGQAGQRRINDHILLRFSCPQSVSAMLSEGCAGMQSQIERTVTERLGLSQIAVTVVVHHSVQIMDRVAM
ncbi:uncharacterized protein BXZ73DRAFT_51152, partial [Epithele typhae]|uniref:uncharacterized protein n=1 Tax=Epithele typhae TaxID=378194 RepID=UPI002008074F